MGDSPNDAAGHRARLRQRLFAGGPRALLDHEIVEYLLALTIPRVDTKTRAKALIDKFGGVGPLLAADVEILKREKLSEATVAALKIAEAAALRLLDSKLKQGALISSSEALAEYLHAEMALSAIEEVRVLYLNSKNRLLANEPMWEGTVDQAAVHVREVIRRALDLGATALIIIHNHPSGDPTPSQQDIALTRDLVDAGRHMNIAIHDHVIVGREGQSSLRAMGLI